MAETFFSCFCYLIFFFYTFPIKAQVELEEKENIQMSKLPDYFAKKRESLEIHKVEKEKVIDQKKIG